MTSEDYRLQLKNKYLRRFMKRFDCKKVERERIDNIGREFKEELVDTGIVNWDKISYRYCGRHITELKYSDHFQVYELLLADVAELMPTVEQEQWLKELMNIDSPKYHFVTSEQINCLGVDIEAGELYEWIGDQTKKILQENENNLIKIHRTGQVFTVNL